MKALHFLLLYLSSRRKETIPGDLERWGRGRYKDSVGERWCLLLDLNCGTLSDLLGVRAFSPFLSETQFSSRALKLAENLLLF